MKSLVLIKDGLLEGAVNLPDEHNNADTVVLSSVDGWSLLLAKTLALSEFIASIFLNLALI